MQSDSSSSEKHQEVPSTRTPAVCKQIGVFFANVAKQPVLFARVAVELLLGFVVIWLVLQDWRRRTE